MCKFTKIELRRAIFMSSIYVYAFCLIVSLQFKCFVLKFNVHGAVHS